MSLKEVIVKILLRWLNWYAVSSTAITQKKYRRSNPWYENVWAWKARGFYLFNDDSITVYNSTTVVGDVSVGGETWIGPFCSLDGSGGLKIGKNCSISAATHIQTHDSVKWALSGGVQAYDYAPVVVGDNCFIGIGVTIVKGVEIGSCSVIGAGAVVTKDIPAYSIAVGVPAKVVGKVVKNERGEVSFEYA